MDSAYYKKAHEHHRTGTRPAVRETRSRDGSSRGAACARHTCACRFPRAKSRRLARRLFCGDIRRTAHLQASVSSDPTKENSISETSGNGLAARYECADFLPQESKQQHPHRTRASRAFGRSLSPTYVHIRASHRQCVENRLEIVIHRPERLARHAQPFAIGKRESKARVKARRVIVGIWVV